MGREAPPLDSPSGGRVPEEGFMRKALSIAILGLAAACSASGGGSSASPSSPGRQSHGKDGTGMSEESSARSDRPEGSGAPGEVPGDFRLRYEWREGALPPPDHYEYTITLGPGSTGEIVFTPDYPQFDPPVWREQFEIEDQGLPRLHAAAAIGGLLRAGRPAREADRLGGGEGDRLGGSVETLEILAGGTRYVAPEGEDLGSLVDLVRSMVPEKTWKELMDRREQFVRRYPPVR